MAGERYISLRPISRQSKALKDASCADAATGQRKRRMARIGGQVADAVALEDDPWAARDVLYPPNCHDRMDRFDARVAMIDQLKAMEASEAVVVAVMRTYNAAEAGDVNAAERLPDMIVTLMDAWRAGLTPAPPGYWKREWPEPNDDDPWI